MNSFRVKPLKNEIVDDFITSNDLFTTFKETPVNIIFLDNFINNINNYQKIFKNNGMSENVFFSCKANKSDSLLETAANQGCGIEVSSYYELTDALNYTKKIIASGPAKDMKYLKLAIDNNTIISVDDIEELKFIKGFGQDVNVMLRISDLLGIKSRFGINRSQIDSCLDIIEGSNVKLYGFSFHINNYNLDDRINAVLQILEIVDEKKLNIEYIDIGGGIPINYCSKEEFWQFSKENNYKMYFKEKNIENFYPYYNNIASEKALEYIIKNIKKKNQRIQIIVELGRSLLNNCGISIYEVAYLKKFDYGDNLIITNGNINCLSEQWFNTDYLIEPLLYKKNKNAELETIHASVAGNLCLEQDILTWRKIKFEKIPEKGDFMIYYNTAGYQMDSNESCFHKIPLVKKFVVKKMENKYEIRSDKSDS